MNYITFEAKTYDEAVKKARMEYGDRLRIQSRRDVYEKGLLGLGQVKKCEITCYILDEPKKKVSDEEIKEFEKEAQTPDPVVPIDNTEELERIKKEMEEKKIEQAKERAQNLLEKARALLLKNDFTSTYTDHVVHELGKILDEACPATPTDEEFEMALIDKIAGSIVISHEYQECLPHISAFIGGSSSGKTTTISKIAGMYSSMPSSEMKKSSAIIAVEPVEGSFEQLKKLGIALDIPVSEASDINDVKNEISLLSSKDVIFLDTVGCPYFLNKVDSDQKRLFAELNTDEKPSFFMVVPAYLKNNDVNAVFDTFKAFDIKGLVITKLDETSTIGNIISICYDRDLPLVFTSDGKRIPRDLKKAGAASLLLMLKGFSVDVSKFLGLDKD